MNVDGINIKLNVCSEHKMQHDGTSCASLKPVSSVFICLFLHATTLMRYLTCVCAGLFFEPKRPRSCSIAVSVVITVYTGSYWSVFRFAKCAERGSRMLERAHASSQVRSRPPVFALIVRISHSWRTDTPIQVEWFDAVAGVSIVRMSHEHRERSMRAWHDTRLLRCSFLTPYMLNYCNISHHVIGIQICHWHCVLQVWKVPNIWCMAMCIAIHALGYVEHLHNSSSSSTCSTMWAASCSTT